MNREVAVDRILRITLAGIEPAVWRRVEVEDCTLLRLHKVIQAGMGWEGRHAWALVLGGEEYGDDVIDAGGDREFASARRPKLGRFVGRGVRRFYYVYDLGANWEHVIEVEGVQGAEPGVQYPRCLGGGRACPPEDCGGPRGYSDFLERLRKRGGRGGGGLPWWVGGEFDPEAFDIGAVNRALGAVR